MPPYRVTVARRTFDLRVNANSLYTGPLHDHVLLACAVLPRMLSAPLAALANSPYGCRPQANQVIFRSAVFVLNAWVSIAARRLGTRSVGDAIVRW